MDLRIRLVQDGLTLTDTPRLRKQTFDYPDVSARGIRRAGGALDLYWPKDLRKPLPLILDLHGGGLVYGHNLNNRWTASEMARRGFFVALFEYPLMPKAALTTQLESIRQVINLLAQLDLPILRDQFHLKGDSAGGLLALLTAMEWQQTENNSDPAALHLQSLSLIHPLIHTNRRDILGYIGDYLTPPQLREQLPADNLAHLRDPLSGIAQLPPVWLQTSENDVMFHREGLILRDALLAQGHALEFRSFPFRVRQPLPHVFMITQPQRSESQALYDDLAAFLRQGPDNRTQSNQQTKGITTEGISRTEQKGDQYGLC